MIPAIAFFVYDGDVEIRVSEDYDALSVDEQQRVLSLVANAAQAMLEDSKREDGCAALHRILCSRSETRINFNV